MIQADRVIPRIQADLDKANELSYISAGLVVAGKISRYIPWISPYAHLAEKIGAAGTLFTSIRHRMTISKMLHLGVANNEPLVLKVADALKNSLIPLGISALVTGTTGAGFPLIFGAGIFTILNYECLYDYYDLTRNPT